MNNIWIYLLLWVSLIYIAYRIGKYEFFRKEYKTRILFGYMNTYYNGEDFAITPYLYGWMPDTSEVKIIGLGLCWGYYSVTVAICNNTPEGFPTFKNYTNKIDDQNED